MGPTASGKSAIALELAQLLPVEIVSVDSAQVYRGMDIGTAKPDAATRACVPHHLLDLIDPDQSYSAARFRADALAAIDTLTNKVIATIPIGQAPQALTYVPNAVPEGDGTQGLVPLGLAGETTHLVMRAASGDKKDGAAPTTVSLFDQGLTQVLQAAVTGLEAKQPYVMALALDPGGQGALEPLTAFMTNPAGSAIVNAVGPIRQIVQDQTKPARRYLVIVPGTPDRHGAPVQLQAD